MQRSSPQTLGILLAGLLAGLSGASCYSGAAADGSGAADSTSGVGEEGTDSSGDTPTTAASSDSGEDPTEGGAPVEVRGPTLRRLTGSEFAHSVTDLLGPVTLAAVEADSLQDGFFAVGAAQVALSPAGVALYETALDLATAEAFADPARIAQVLACVPAQLGDTVCLRDALASFGRRAWRRPLTGPELERYLTIATTVGTETGDVVVGLRHAIWALLQSPYFLYRVEIGQSSPTDDGRRKFSSYEMASRLAFTLWNTLPDEALLDAAERDELADNAGIAAQATRMLADPRARQGVENFVSELYGLWSLADEFKEDALFPEWTPTLRAVIRDDLLARIDEVVFTAPGDFFALYDDTKVFVNNELALIYGLPTVEPDMFRAATLPEDGMRRGLIGSAAVLAMNSLPARTSATKRGQFIAEALLCRTVPPPPPTVDTNLDDDPMEMEGPRTLREKLEPHRSDPACSGCHNITDPLGLALEHFDTIGRFRATDQGLTIDASGELDGIKFLDGGELAGVLRDHPEAPRCLVRKLYTYTAGRSPFAPETATLNAIEDAMADAGNRFDLLLYTLVTHDDFRFAHPPGTVIVPDQPEGDKP